MHKLFTTQTQPEGDNKYAQDNSVYPVLETLAEGSVVEMKVVMSTYHWVSCGCLCHGINILRSVEQLLNIPMVRV